MMQPSPEPDADPISYLIVALLALIAVGAIVMFFSASRG
jgi:hypothetical protein